MSKITVEFPAEFFQRLRVLERILKSIDRHLGALVEVTQKTSSDALCCNGKCSVKDEEA